MIVICANDYPYAVMPPGATEAQARELCAELKRRELLAEAAKSGAENHLRTRPTYYHWHDVPEITA